MLFKKIPRRKHRRAKRVIIYFDGIEVEEMNPMKVGQLIEGGVAFKDKDGFDAKVEGAPKWGSNDPSVLEVTQSEDGLSCVVKALKPGSAKVSVVADADLGEGVKEIVGEADVVVLSGEAVEVDLSFTEPHDA